MPVDPYRRLIRLVWLGVTASCLALAGFTLWTDLRARERLIATARATNDDIARALDQEATQLFASVGMLLTTAASRVASEEAGARERLHPDPARRCSARRPRPCSVCASSTKSAGRADMPTARPHWPSRSTPPSWRLWTALPAMTSLSVYPYGTRLAVAG